MPASHVHKIGVTPRDREDHTDDALGVNTAHLPASVFIRLLKIFSSSITNHCFISELGHRHLRPHPHQEINTNSNTNSANTIAIAIAMRLLSPAAGSLARATAYFGAIDTAANTAPPGVLDFGLVFPRPNETYEPTDRFPIVFALQNAELAKHLYLNVWFRLINSTNRDWLYNTGNIDISTEWNSVQSPSEPFLYWQYLEINGEGPIRLIWQPSWVECHEDADGVEFVNNNTLHIADFGVDFGIKRDGRKADLVAATSNNEQCPDRGHAIQVTNQTREVPPRPGRDGRNGTCAVLTFPSPTPTADPCRVKIDKAVVESMSAVELQRRCKGFVNPPAECPKEDRAVQKSAIVAAAASFAAALSAFVFLLV